MSEKRFFGFAEFSNWVSEKFDEVLATVTSSLESKVNKTDDFGQYKVGELELAVLLADLASGADLATLQQGFNDFVAAKASVAEAVAGTDDVKYITALSAKAAIESAVNELVGSSPEALDTIAELAAAMQNSPDVIANLTTLVGQKLDATANAVSASKLQTARTITIGNTSKSFDGSANVSWSLDEIGVTDAFNDSIITGDAIINVGSVDGVAVIYSGISTEHVIVLKVEVNAGTNDRYDIEIYDGAFSSGGTLVYRAQQVQGNYLDSFAFYHQCQNTDLHARVVNLRQDGASFSANVKITLRLE